MNETLRPFQRRFLASALAPGIDTACLSIPRGNGKSWLAGHVLTRCLTPGDALHVSGSEYLLCAASIEQARIVFRFIREVLEPTGEYRWIDSSTRIGCTHLETNTKLRILSSNAKSAMGLVKVGVVVADEPGSWEVVGGQLMFDALQTALGKPGSPMKILYVGTLAPSQSGWWHDLIDGGSHGSTHVTSLKADPTKWDSYPEIRRVNPLMSVFPDSRKKLLAERDEARADSRLKSRFLSFRMNVPTADESQLLLTVDDWQRVAAREVTEPEGRPLVGVDMGGGRAWSAAVALWPSGRMEAIALAPGIPSVGAQERRDRVATGTYQKLVDVGLLRIADGLRVPSPGQLWDAMRAAWGRPKVIVCDRFRLAELQDTIKGGARIEARVTRWSDAAFDIRALRKGAKDGPFNVTPESLPLIAASLAVSQVKNDDAGNVRLVKSSTNNTARDDVSSAMLLASGAFARLPTRKRKHYLGLAG